MNTSNENNKGKDSENQPEKKGPKPPSINLPKGGGAIRGIGEKFAANPVTGTGSMSVPVYVSPGRSGFEPKIMLSYDSGAGNGPFGLGWNVDIPTITRKTDKGLPRYLDSEESDTFVLSGAEDLVPVLIQSGDQWIPDVDSVNAYGDVFTVKRYRPRTEGLFAKIERWTKQNGECHWQITTKDNITTLYGFTNNSRVYDHSAEDLLHPQRIFSWLICGSYDTKGNCIVYTYKEENADNVATNDVYEMNRTSHVRSTQRYIKKVQYGNTSPWYINTSVPLSFPSEYHFELIFDYGDHGLNNPQSEPTQPWTVRPDSFSSYRSGFEIRTYRLCRRILMYHNFPEESNVGSGYLVRSTDITYTGIANDPDDIATGIPCFSFISTICQSGYKKQPDNSYVKKTLPEVTFMYSYPQIGTESKIITAEILEGMHPGPGSNAEWSDLYGEGITGLLARYSQGWLYKGNITPLQESGDITFSSLKQVSQLPSVTDDNEIRFMDLAGDGRPDMVVLDNTIAGYYELELNDTLSNFRSIDSVPNINWNDPNLRFVDLTGDGLADILITEADVFTWYESKGEDGFFPSKTVNNAIDENKGPRVIFADSEMSVYLADMSGDGLSDIVRIRNGEVCYWSNLGYGKFGAKITMGNAPLFDTEEIFNQKRILLADIDGSGLTDILYLSAQGVQIYFNLSGNALSNPYIINCLPQIDSLATVTAFDLLGNGTACLVWTSTLPSHKEIYYVPLMTNGKPHLLTRVENNMGAETQISYAPSTKYYLEDKLAGRPWVTRLSFPVHVVDRLVVIDHIGNNRLTSQHRYHHGYFDGTEREFRGFGMVETIDTETFSPQTRLQNPPQGDLEDGAHYVAPVLTKTWYHTGADIHDSDMANIYAQEYWNGDPDAFELPDTVIPSLTPDEHREAVRALRGSTLRQEIYEVGISIPYQVIETNLNVQQLQPKVTNKHGVYFTHGRESITFHYEQNSSDPRVGHEFVFEVDEYGNVKRSASLVYPRRAGTAGIFNEQQKPYFIFTNNSYINVTTPFYLVGVPCESRSFEIGGNLPVANEQQISHAEMVSFVTTALLNEIAYGVDFNTAINQARCFSWSRSIFWNDNQSAALPFGQITARALVHHEETAVFTSDLIASTYNNQVIGAMVAASGYSTHDGYIWNAGIITLYQNGTYYLPVRTDDRLGGFYTIAYDTYYLSATQVTDALNNVISAEIDYRTLQPYLLTDPNGNTSEVFTDALGMVIATSVYGEEQGVEMGDMPLRGTDGYSEIENPTIAQILVNPQTYLQNATSFFHYDLNAWVDRSEPPQFIVLARERHVNEESDAPPESPAGGLGIQMSLGFSDGFGRSIQNKVRVEPGVAWVQQSDNTFIEQQVIDRWLVSGRTVYNNKQKPVKQYEPFYSGAWEYEDEEFFAEYGVTPVIHYDPLLRVVRTDTPKGFFSKVAFTPWEVRTYDENDTVKDSDYYSRFVSLPLSEQDALRKAEVHYNTPTTQQLDTLGRAFRIEEYLSAPPQTPENTIVTKSTFDINGKPLTVTDPRDIVAFSYTYAMDGHTMRTVSADAGDDRSFADVMGNPVISFNSRGYNISFTYDLLHRPLQTKVTGNGLDNITERIIYGESQSNPESRNLRGKVYQHYDQAGLVTVSLYSFKGEPKQTEQCVRTDYKTEANWTDAANWNALLDSELFVTDTKTDALGRVLEEDSPDGSRSHPEYHQSGKLNKMEVRLRGENTFTTFVNSIRYNAKGQRERIVYGNTTRTDYMYERETFRLTGLITTRTSDNRELQNITYTYDPVGNITQIIDNSHHRVFNAGNIIDAESEFVYDALYRLSEAQGREHLALNNPLISNYQEFKQSVYTHINDTQNMGLYTQNYSYDKSGNLTRIRHVSSADSARNFTSNFVIAANSNRAIPDTMGSDVASCFDPNGNMTTLEHLVGIDWNYRDNISKATIVKRPSGIDDAEYYIYGADGQRVRKIKETLGDGNIGIEEKIYLGSVEIKRVRTAGSLTLKRIDKHIMDDTSRIAIVNNWTVDTTFRETDSPADINSNKTRYIYSNHLGSASLELNSTGQIISYEEYFPYGGTSFTTGTSQKEVKLKEYRYTGKECDDTTGLYYYGARYYAPWTGRWLSADPSGSSDGLNLYKYVRDNPIILVDPNGDESEHAKYLKGVADAVVKIASGGSSIADIKAAYQQGGGAFEGTLNAIDKANPIAKIRDAAIEGYKEQGGGFTGVLNAIDRINPIARMRDTAIEAYHEQGGGLLGTLNAIDRLNPVAQIRDESVATIEAIQSGDTRAAGEHFTNTLIGVAGVAAAFTTGGASVATTPTILVKNTIEEGLEGAFGAKYASGKKGVNLNSSDTNAGVSSNVKKTDHGNLMTSQKIQHGYKIIKRSTGEIQEYGISGQKLNTDGSSPRVTQKLRQKYSNDRDYEGVVIKKNIINRQKALNWEYGKVKAYSKANPMNEAPPRQYRPKVKG
jgi:RHS repeat-associated protein